jgi:hypothetical protein
MRIVIGLEFHSQFAKFSNNCLSSLTKAHKINLKRFRKEQQRSSLKLNTTTKDSYFVSQRMKILAFDSFDESADDE